MSQHPYARSTSPMPDSHSDFPVVRRTVSAFPDSQGSHKRPAGKLQTNASASMTELDPSLSSRMSIIGPHYRRHFVKQENMVTLVLSGHSGGADKPVYTSGNVLHGLVTISKPKNVSSIVVNLEGSLKLRDLQGGSVGTSVFFSETLYSWDGSYSRAPAPPEFNFETIVPVFIPPANERRILPPTYHCRLGAIGSASVQYEAIVSVVRQAGPMEFWKKRTRLRVPFIFRPLTRPQAAGPFPASSTRHSSERPQTVFLATIRPQNPKLHPAEVQLFLPSGQVVPLAERIHFRLALRAPNSYLDELFTASATSQALPSFLPIPSLTSDTMCSFDSNSDFAPSLRFKSIRQPRLVLRVLEPNRTHQPVKVRYERRVIADAREPSGPIFSWARGRRVVSTEVLAEAQLHREKYEDGRVKWWGSLDLPADVGSAGFVADKLVIQDYLVVSIDVPGISAYENPFRCSIPLRLTSHPARAVAAVKVGEPDVRR